MTRPVERLACPDVDGGPLDFIYGHTGPGCRVDAGHPRDRSALPAAAEVVELLGHPLMRAQAVRVVTAGESRPVRAFSQRVDFNSKVVDDSLNSRALRRAFAVGSTVIVEDVGKWHAPVAAIANRIFNDRWLYANAGYFITRSGHRGLPFHADEETTFVFQLAGSKTWHVADYPAARLGGTEVPPDARVVEFDLRPGDAACIPPMYPHRTEAVGGGDSIHLTIGVRPFKLKDLFADLAGRGLSRIPALDAGIDSIESSLDPLIAAARGPQASNWRQELAIASIRVASGVADRGFEFGWPDGDRKSCAPALGDLMWRVRLGQRSMVHLSGAFAMMDDAAADALANAVAERAARGCPWSDLVAEGQVPAAVRRLLDAAGWDAGTDGQGDEG